MEARVKRSLEFGLGEPLCVNGGDTERVRVQASILSARQVIEGLRRETLQLLPEAERI
jgi:hypothetical protein